MDNITTERLYESLSRASFSRTPEIPSRPNSSILSPIFDAAARALVDSISPEASLQGLSGRTSLHETSRREPAAASSEYAHISEDYEYMEHLFLPAAAAQRPLNITGSPVLPPAAASSDQPSPKRPSPKRAASHLSPIDEESRKRPLFFGAEREAFNDIKSFTRVPLARSDAEAEIKKLQASSQEIAILRTKCREFK